MKNTFDSRLKPCGGNDHLGSSAQDAKGDSLSLSSGAIDGPPAPDLATAHRTDHAFLTKLMTYDTREECGQMRHRLAKAERDGKCIRHALFLVVVLFLVCLIGLSFCALFQPELSTNFRHLAMRGLCIVGLASFLSQGAFLGYLLWHRTAVGRLHHECRRLVLMMVESKLDVSPNPVSARKRNGESSWAPVSSSPLESLVGQRGGR
jgi:hypothetical protein